MRPAATPLTPNRFNVEITAQAEDPSVEKSVQHHRDHINGFFIGDAAPRHHARRHARALQ